MDTHFDVGIIGGGIAGMATAARLQAKGLKTIVFEAHATVGGCAGYFRKKGFAFDVGATTLVDFQPGGVGDELLKKIGMPLPENENLPGYIAWLPDRNVTLYREQDKWAKERIEKLGNSENHFRFWRKLDLLSDTFWEVSRNGMALPIKRFSDFRKALSILTWQNLPLIRYLFKTVDQLLEECDLQRDKPLKALLNMLIEDTVHSNTAQAPIINAALGVTIRGAGLTRADGGMFGFWRKFIRRYIDLGGIIKLSHPVLSVTGKKGDFQIKTAKTSAHCSQIVSAMPLDNTAKIAPKAISQEIKPKIQAHEHELGSAMVVFLGVPEAEVRNDTFTHHQLLQDYDKPFGYGNNMFISISRKGDLLSAPEGYRAVMISTHCDHESWIGLKGQAYQNRKQTLFDELLGYARRVYPDLGKNALVKEMGTPKTYEHFTRRKHGTVGGFKQNLSNTNQFAIGHKTKMPGFWIVGDQTWPGLGTVACTLGSRIVAERVYDSM